MSDTATIEAPPQEHPAKTKGGVIVALPQELRDEARSRYMNGETPTQISVALGIKSKTVSMWITRGKWAVLRNPTPAPTPAIQPTEATGELVHEVGGPSATPVALVVHTSDARVEALRSKLCAELESQVEALEKEPIQSAKELASIPGAAGREGRSSVVKRIVDAFEGLYPETKAQGLVLMDLLTARPPEKPAIDVSSTTTPCGSPQAPETGQK